ncbi:hypothetical protein J8F10_01700 [Gemmata sp. G18]|uniref:Uncharacterized protein n=1 Tax=Gemmata palustris TaxID=2822762 RepID=A0ABS5BKK3_9BACT|nr:hypothetical protein [Gemmata palustris]MBP3954012.1 hypothetical protein [Gemmata palustris]
MRYAIGHTTNARFEAEKRYFEAREKGDRAAMALHERVAFGKPLVRAGGTMAADVAAINALLRNDPVPAVGRPGGSMAADLMAIQATLARGNQRPGARRQLDPEDEIDLALNGFCDTDFDG